MKLEQVKVRHSILVIVFCMFLFSACNGSGSSSGGSTSDSGSVNFSVVYHGAAGKTQSKAAVIDCTGEGISNVEAAVYGPEGSLLVGGGPWECEVGKGTITSVPAGIDRTVVMLGKRADGNIVFYGRKSGIQIVVDSENDAGTIDCYDFAPTLQTPADGATVEDGTIELQWNDVIGAADYRILVSENNDMTDPIIDHTTTKTNYAPAGLSISRTYYWRVVAADSYANSGVGSVIWSFNVAMANNAPIAQINNPANGSTYLVGDEIVFAGSGSDSEDGPLSGESLKWRSDVDGPICEDETCSSSALTPGNHHITLTATDSQEASGIDAVVITVATGRLPDTGQTTDYTDISGEDSDYSIHPPSYTKLDGFGNDLDDLAKSWETVRDNVTGLIWDSKIFSDRSEHTWQAAQENYIDQLNSDKYGGYDDWRLPVIKELYTIVHKEKDEDSPAINTTYFEEYSMLRGYWSSTTLSDVDSTDRAWIVDLDSGKVNTYPKSSGYYVRAVRGGQNNSNLVDNGDGTVTDIATGLMWQQDESSDMTWDYALTYCEELELANYDDWRLPNSKELQSIVDYGKPDGPSIDTTLFPKAEASGYWSSTTYAHDTDDAWYVHFDDGSVKRYFKTTNNFVRAVRGGQ